MSLRNVILTSHDAVRDDHNPDIGRKCAKDESGAGYESADDSHGATTEPVGQHTRQWTCQSANDVTDSNCVHVITAQTQIVNILWTVVAVCDMDLKMYMCM